MRIRNILKRNSGFVAVSIISAGASFLAADTVLTELRPGSMIEERESESENGRIEIVTEKETKETVVYETNPFTVTASGTVINRVEKEALKKETEGETTPETEEKGNEAASVDDRSESGSVNGETGSEEEAQATDHAGADASDHDTGWNTPEYSSDGTVSGTSDNSGSDANDGSEESRPAIEILDSGSGSYTYSGSWEGGSSGGETSSGGGGSSGSGSSSSGGTSSGSGSSSAGGASSGSGSSSGGGTSSGSGASSGGGSSSGGASSSDGGSYENGIFSPDDLILWHINSRYIGEEELYNYDAATIRYIRNEIFALHGRIFLSEDLNQYFRQKSWYTPTYDPEYFDNHMESFLNDYELANLNVILAYEDAMNG